MACHCGPSGKELAARRKAAGFTQSQLAEQAEVGRSAVQYWERMEQIDARGWAVRRMASVLGWSLSAWKGHHYAQARGRGDSQPQVPDWREAIAAQASAAYEAWQAREAQRAATRRVICGAKTRKGTACRNKSEPGRMRCKFHGGMSTGARTPEGIERIREAQRRRWGRRRAAQGV